jgi:hypothetical protein
MVDPVHSEARVQDAVARADQARRVRDTTVALWTAAPIVAGVCLLVAIAGRLLAWAPFVTLLVLGLASTTLAGFAFAGRRSGTLSDAEVARFDADAELQGELRSAHWFALSPDRDDWIALHLARAGERVHGVDWPALYPAPTAGRAKLLTGALAVGAVMLALFVPGRAGLAASGAHGPIAPTQPPRVLIALPADVRKKLEDLLVTAESGQGRPLTASEVRDLLARLDDLAKHPYKPGDPAANAAGQPPDASKADIKALAERAKKASESTSLEPSVRDALSDLAAKLGEPDQAANAMGARDPQDAAVKGDAGGEVQQSKSGSGKQGDASPVQSVQDAAGGSAVGVVMMTTDSAANARDGGLGLGGGAADKNGGGHLVDLGAALRRETIEAARDLQGENVQTEQRRKTEHADATAAFTHAAAQPAERGNSTAPPPVPESRRAAVKSYFIRKP